MHLHGAGSAASSAKLWTWVMGLSDAWIPGPGGTKARASKTEAANRDIMLGLVPSMSVAPLT